MIVGLDFDGTVVAHRYPELGEDIGAIPWLLAAQDIGARFVLFTMRDGDELVAAAQWLADHGIQLHGVNVNPSQWTWTMSPKAYCHLYVDDNGLGMPTTGDERPYVDWGRAGPLLVEAVQRWIDAHPGGGREIVQNRGRYRPEAVLCP